MSSDGSCTWPGDDMLMKAYHNNEWGTPQHDDHALMEYLVLDMFQAGLSWRTVLHKRQAFARAFSGYDIKTIAGYGGADVDRLMQDAGIVRNRLKIVAAIAAAHLVQELQVQYGSLDTYLWQFVNGHPIVHSPAHESQIGATSPESDVMSHELRAKGFKFVGSTICYAFMQGAGLINDHIVSCPRYGELVAASDV